MSVNSNGGLHTVASTSLKWNFALTPDRGLDSNIMLLMVRYAALSNTEVSTINYSNTFFVSY